MSRESAILLAAGTDRPGIVDRISGVVFEAGWNLEDSRMSILGGEFALMVLVRGVAETAGALRTELEAVAEELGLVLHLKPVRGGPAASSDLAVIPYKLHAVALDHPGIVHRVTHVLRESGVNVSRLDSRVSAAPTTGTPVFSLEIELLVPANESLGRLRGKLQKLADDQNIDITLAPSR